MRWSSLGRILLLLHLSLGFALLSGRAAASDDAIEFFERQVRPLLAAKCWECHGDDAAEGGLRLSTRAAVLKGGQSGPIVVERQPASSRLVQAIRRTGKLKMPPDQPLNEDEIAVLTRWVEVDLPWPNSPPSSQKQARSFEITPIDRQHWSFRPVTAPRLPDVSEPAWTRDRLDRFVLRYRESNGAPPHSIADRGTLIRRLYVDLTGMPPTWEEMSDHLDDAGPAEQMLDRLADRLLASPRFGERWGRHWLDVARFADTKDGVLMYGDDRVRPFAYTYRDYVIRATNDDTPFDRFVHEQLAADLIQPAVEPWRLAAMGFLTLGRLFDNNIHDVIDDQIDTLSRGFLGLTVACARCHDHKYDPVSMADYYSLYSVFASSEIPLELPVVGLSGTMAEALEFEQQYSAKRDEIRAFRDEQFQQLTETARRRVADYLEHVATTRPDPLESSIFFLSLAPDDLRPPITARWRRFLDQPGMAEHAVFAPWHELITSLPVAVDFTEDQLAAARERWQSKPAGTGPGEINPLVRDHLERAALKTRADLARAYGELLRQIVLESPSSESSNTAPVSLLDASKQQLLELVAGRTSPAFFPRSQTRRYMSREQTDQYGGKLQELDRMAVKSPLATPRAMVMHDAEVAYDPRIFVRGNPTQLGRSVPRQFIELLSAKPLSAGSGRLDLAHAITASDNPLTARVIVNRVWMHHFGEPLAASPSDLGKRSESPAPEGLLDNLAWQFMRDGWSLKRLHRRIVLSASWQQDSRPRHSGGDATIESLGAPRRQRLGFEAMRDTMLSVSGRLQHRLGGRPVNLDDPQQPFRSVYGMVDRQSLPGMFRTFDFASPDQSVERRPRTMVPQQALFALNSQFVMEQAKAVIRELEWEERYSVDADRITRLFQRILLRSPTAGETSAASEFIQMESDTATQMTRWELLAQVLLSSNELMYVD